MKMKSNHKWSSPHPNGQSGITSFRYRTCSVCNQVLEFSYYYDKGKLRKSDSDFPARFIAMSEERCRMIECVK